MVACDTTHVKVEATSRVTDELTSVDDVSASVARHAGMVSSTDASLPPLMSIMPSAKRARFVLKLRLHVGDLCVRIILAACNAIYRNDISVGCCCFCYL